MKPGDRIEIYEWNGRSEPVDPSSLWYKQLIFADIKFLGCVIIKTIK